MALLARDFMVRRRLMPVRLDDDGNLVLAMTNPLDVITIDEVGMRTKKHVVPVICTESGFDEAVALYFSTRGKLREAREESGDEGADATPATIDTNIIEIVDGLLADAASMDASDIHLEPRDDSLNVRCRIDGVLHDLREFPKDLQAGIISRLKIMGNLDIAERRLPQDGRTTFELASGRSVDLRLASIPSLYGENITIRILEVSPLPPTLSSLGLIGDNLAPLRAGPRGPGGPHRHRRAHGFGQVHHPLRHPRATSKPRSAKVSPSKTRWSEDHGRHPDRGEAGHRRHVLPGAAIAGARYPDVIMVGEIRDLETAKMAADAARYRSPGVQHIAHERRVVGGEPCRRDGRAALPGGRPLGIASWPSGWCAGCAPAAASPRPLPTSAGKSCGSDQHRERIRVRQPRRLRQMLRHGYRRRLGLYKCLVVMTRCAT